MTPPAACRFCGADLSCEACDLGDQPLANSLVPMDAPDAPDPRFPLRVMVCSTCLLVQLEQTADPGAMFTEYSYMSSVSSLWRAHTIRFAAKAVDRFGLTANSLVMEAGSNDGTLLSAFARHGIPTLGIDPAANVAEEARRRGVPTLTAFFGERTATELAKDGRQADLLVANNVLAHAPALMDFVRGIARALKPTGVLSIEVPHVLAMLDGGQFDTIYHEHVFYFSALVLQKVLAAARLAIFDVESLPTHGGSLRLFAQHAETGQRPGTAALDQLVAAERNAALHQPQRYRTLTDDAARVVGGLRDFLTQARVDGAVVAAYGAAAKGTMLLNAARPHTEDIVFIADASPLKQGHRIPGCRVPIAAPDRLRAVRPDFLLVLPWNIADEIMEATRFIAGWGGRFVIPSPVLRIIEA
jgi:2-polyprenyl-3-methyl-5-hydroxy-6-metoxy-1,4-benzoquinol methylase